LFPIDSAFKRRWSWEYIPINYNKDETVNESAGYMIELGENGSFKWIDFIEKVNKDFIINNPNLREDKCIGNYFIKPDSNIISLEVFINKAIFYLWIDVFKDEVDSIFDQDITFESFFPIETNGLKMVTTLVSKLGILIPPLPKP